jgi:predicted amino acid-binding ACT domain protein
MTDVGRIVDLVSRALGPGARPKQIESVAAAVMDEVLRPGPPPATEALREVRDTITVAAVGPADAGALCTLIRSLTEAGCQIQDLTQSARDGSMVISIVALLGRDRTVSDVRDRLNGIASSVGLRVAVHHRDLAQALENW